MSIVKLSLFHKTPLDVFIFLLFLSLFVTACPEPPDNEIECGSNQVEVNGDCECEEGYHWNDDRNECLLDTTSHDFVWEVIHLGDLTSYWNDVAIIPARPPGEGAGGDENDIWVVGYARKNDTTFGASLWNGINWQLKQLSGSYIGVSSITPRGIWYFSDDNIWFASGSIYHWDGQETSLLWTRDLTTNETVEKIWASSESDIYFVGNEGLIVHYNGNVFTRMESGTEVDLHDVWGSPDGVDVWACGFQFHNATTVLLHYDGSHWNTVYQVLAGRTDTSYTGRIVSVWTTEADTIYILSEYGLYHQPINGDEGAWFESISFPSGPLHLRGNHRNDMFIVGEEGMVGHYNGRSWHFYEEVYHPDYRLKSVSVKGDIAVAVGEDYREGIQRDVIIIGYR